MKKIFIITFLSFYSLFGYTQSDYRFLSFGPSATAYKGDLNDKYKTYNAAFHAEIYKVKETRIQTAVDLNIGSVSGNNYLFQSSLDESSNQPNTFFQTTYISGAFNFRLFLLKKGKFRLYVSQGLGGMRFTPKNEHDSTLVNMKTSRAEKETYSQFTFILPRSIGVIYFINEEFSINFNIVQLAPRTDYIDNISKLGDSKKKDKILQYQLSLAFPIKKE